MVSVEPFLFLVDLKVDCFKYYLLDKLVLFKPSIWEALLDKALIVDWFSISELSTEADIIKPGCCKGSNLFIFIKLLKSLRNSLDLTSTSTSSSSYEFWASFASPLNAPLLKLLSAATFACKASLRSITSFKFWIPKRKRTTWNSLDLFWSVRRNSFCYSS